MYLVEGIYKITLLFLLFLNKERKFVVIMKVLFQILFFFSIFFFMHEFHYSNCTLYFLLQSAAYVVLFRCGSMPKRM